MKHFFYSFLVVTLIVSVASSCKKKASTPFTYIVNDLTDVTVAQTDSVSIPVQVQTLTGNAEAVTLSLGGIPSNIATSIIPSTGTPNYNAVIKFKPSAAAAIGTTLISVNSTSASTGTKSYNINLTVSAAPIRKRLLGTWIYTSHVTDSNNNGVMDDRVITASLSEIVTFNSDGTANDTQNGLTSAFNWTLTGNDSTTLNLIFNGSTNSYHLDQLDDTTFVAKYSASSPIVWSIFTKQ
jgi:hypothetical protein